MMRTGKKLNRSSGLFLQSLCKQLINDILNNNYQKKLYFEVLRLEIQRLCNEKTIYGNKTSSDQAYQAFLCQLEGTISSENNTVKCLEEILETIVKETRDKLHVLFLVQEPACWPSLESVYYASLENKQDFNTSIVYTHFEHKNITDTNDHYHTYLNDIKIPILRESEYNLEEDSPDVAFILKPYNNVPPKYQIKNLQKVIRRFVYIPYGMEVTTDLIEYGFQYYLHYKAWRHCAYGEIVKHYGSQYGYRNGENIVVWGHPKADHFRSNGKKTCLLPLDWEEKLKGKKTILWTPHHYITLDSEGTGTWLNLGEKILNLAYQNKDIAFIFRPHPHLIGALINNKYMSSQSVEAMICKIKNSENIIYDDTADYRIAFDLADAIITDGTTFCVEFLYTGRPILLTPRNIKGFYLYEEMIKNYYIAEDINDVAEYIDMIRNDKDPLREKRITMRDDVLFIPEGCSVGENIMNNVKHNLEEECENGLLASYLSDIGSTLSSRTLLKQVPLISILVLCYKNQDLLYEMLDSIFVQDYQRIQLVISDDGSSDFDKNMIEQYIRLNSSNIEEYIVLNNPVNMGTVKHIIYAMQHVKGDYLVFTAADDRFSSEKAISKYIEAFSQNLDAKWIVARCKITTPDYKKVIYIAPTDEDIPFFQSGDSQLLFSRWARRGMGVPCQMCFSRDAIDLVGGFDSNYQYLEDWPLELKLLRNGFAPIYIDEITAVHSTGGISNSNSRYDVLTRKAFYDDKYLLFEREVEPYKDLMASDDLRLYEVYRREILERLYFFHITLYGLSAPAKLKATIRSPKHLCWVLEQQYLKHRHRLKRKQACLVAQVLLFCSMFLLNSDGILESFYRMLGWVNLVGGVLLMILVTVSLPMDLFYTWKKKLRSKLVN